MKKIFFAIGIMLFNNITMKSQVPVIDREIFFGNPEIAAGSLSPDGKYISFSKEWEGIMNIWVKKFDEPFDKAILLTKSKSPILGSFWTYDSKYILYINDNNGDENFNVYAVNPADAPVDGAPPSRNLTPLNEVRINIYSVSRKNPDVMWIGLNDRDKAWHDLYKLEISSGKLTKEFENNDRITGWEFDWDETPRLASRTDENGNSQILRIDGPGKFTKIYETNIKEGAGVVGWNKDNTKFYLESNKGVNLSALYLMDPMTEKIDKVESDPENKVDFGSLFIDRNTREIISTTYVLDKQKRYWKNKNWEEMYTYLQKQFPGREVGFSSFTKDYNKMLISVTGDKYASDVYFYDAKTKKLIHQYTPKPKLKAVEEHLAPMLPISYKSSDNLEIPAYLTLPVGKDPKNLPMVVLVHGGPKGPRDYWGYDPQVQFLANRGYAVLQPNFRASGGYGKDFMNAGDKEWGKKMQDDITWGVKYLIANGTVDKNRVAIMGGSYGGYATLAGLAFTPEVYACGIDIVGPSNLFTLLGSIPAYWEAGRKWMYEMLADPETEEGKKFLTEASPLFSADKIVKPLMIVQGANDPRVKKQEADQIAIALRDKGKDVSYLLAMDEGHGFRKPLNNMALYAEAEKFLAKHIGGVYQQEVPTDVAENIKKLTVDISKVTFEKKSEVKAIEKLPVIKYIGKAAVYTYDVSLEAQGRAMQMEMTRTIKKAGNNWLITEATKGALGESSESAEYTPALAIVTRTISQGGMNITMNFNGSEVDMNAMGKNVKLSSAGLMLSDGAGLDVVLAAMGLKEGQEVSFFVPDMNTGKVKQVVAKVIGTETLDGKVLQKIEMSDVENPAAKTIYWIDAKTQMAVKTEQILPAMGNAKMTVLLKK